MAYWILKRVYSEKVGKKRQPYVWKPKKNFQIVTIPVTELSWQLFMKRIADRLGSGKYRIMRNHFKGESRGMKPVVYLELRGNGQYTIFKRYMQHKAIEGSIQPGFKNKNSRFAPRLSAHERRKAIKRAMLKEVYDGIPKKQTSIKFETVLGVKEFKRTF